jgi:DNA end-binding protein Ku
VAARAIWKGVIRIANGEAGPELPVKLYSAVQDRQVRFHLLHAADGGRVQQRMIHPETGEVVPAEKIQKGFEAEPGVFVLLGEEELSALEPEPAREIRVTRFVDPEALAQQWYDRPYYLGPDGSRQAYFALAQALSTSGKEGVARWVMRKKRYLGALRPTGDGHLLLVTLRHAGEVITADQLEAPGGRAMDAKELELAKQLVAALEGSFDPADYRDDYRQRVLELVESKAKGKKLPAPKAPRRPKKAPPLGEALEASLKAARKEAAGGGR